MLANIVNRQKRVRWLWWLWYFLVPFPLLNILILPFFILIGNGFTVYDLGVYFLNALGFIHEETPIDRERLNMTLYIGAGFLLAFLFWIATLLTFRRGLRKHLAAIKNDKNVIPIILAYGIGVQILTFISVFSVLLSLAPSG